jgi:hypothetical protein
MGKIRRNSAGVTLSKDYLTTVPGEFPVTTHHHQNLMTVGFITIRCN